MGADLVFFLAEQKVGYHTAVGRGDAPARPSSPSQAPRRVGPLQCMLAAAGSSNGASPAWTGAWGVSSRFSAMVPSVAVGGSTVIVLQRPQGEWPGLGASPSSQPAGTGLQ